MIIRKKAVVLGGSNGIGLAITKELIERGYFVNVCDKEVPERDVLNGNDFSFFYCDLLSFNDELFQSLAADQDVEILIVTAGFGRVADFQYHHPAEIEKMLMVNTVNIIKIFRIFYDRIISTISFFAGVMGSISGWMSSPSCSVYAA